MASAETTEQFNCTPDQFFSIITDYEKYPEFLSEVKSCKVVETKGTKKLVEFQVSVVKTFKYRLWLDESQLPKKVSWTLDSGDMFKTSQGHWDIQDLGGGKIKAHYFVEATFKVFVPGPVAKALVSVNLPNMMNAYRKRVETKFSK